MDNIQAEVLSMIRWDDVAGLDPGSPFKLLSDADKLFGSLGISIKEPPDRDQACSQNSTLSEYPSSLFRNFDAMQFSLAVASATFSVLQTATALPASSSLPSLNVLAKQQHKLWFGTAADIPQTNENVEQTDAAYLSILTNPNIFGEMTPANIMKAGFSNSNKMLQY